MSERDEFRECMARELEAADEMAGELGRNSYSYGKAAGLRFALHEYDRLAPERERAAKALQVFEEAAKHGPTDYGCDDTQPLCPLYDYCHWACGAQMLTRLGRDMGILPEEVHRAE